MIPLEVPIAMKADTAIHVGRPKLRLPTSENALSVILLSLVHRSTSQGVSDVSVGPISRKTWLADDDCREWTLRKAGD